MHACGIVVTSHNVHVQLVEMLFKRDLLKQPRTVGCFTLKEHYNCKPLIYYINKPAMQQYYYNSWLPHYKPYKKQLSNYLYNYEVIDYLMKF